MSAREPAEILAELGDALQRASARRRARPRGGACRSRGAAWSWPSPPSSRSSRPPSAPTRRSSRPSRRRCPPELRAPGAVDPSDTGTPVYVAQGAAWKLSASTCAYGTERVVGVFLTVPGGGAGARCDGARPEALAGRRIHTYFDPQTGTTWVFGTLPAAARAVTVAVTEGGAGAAVRSRRDRATRARWPRAACRAGCACSWPSFPARRRSGA